MGKPRITGLIECHLGLLGTIRFHAPDLGTIAADTSRFPFGTKLKFNGNTYTVEDRGGAIRGNRIDLYFSSHSEALAWGVRYMEVLVEK